MAVLKKLEDQLNCSICLDIYMNPKQLQCHHVYCQKCLVKLVIRDQQGQLSLTCPNCRQVTPVPASGVRGLQPAFQINQLLEIVNEHKQTASASCDEIKVTSTSPTPQTSITVDCPQHGGKEVELYCETCGETICWECIMKGSKHHSHEYDKLDKAFEKYRGEIMMLLKPLEKQLASIELALTNVDVHCDELSKQQASIEANIHSTISHLHETLNVRKTELIGQLHKLTRAKLKSLAAQRDQIETTQTQLNSCLLFMRENLKMGSQREALTMKKTTMRQIEQLSATFQPHMLAPSVDIDMVFSAQANFSAECHSYGKVYSESSPDPSKCHVTDTTGADTALVGVKSTVIVELRNYVNQPCVVTTTPLSCELISEIAGTGQRGSVERRKQGQYEISLQPIIKGRHQLHLQVDGQFIEGSPIPVTVRSSVENLSTPILTIHGVRRPEGVAVTQRGEIVVTDWNEDIVSIFSQSGERLRTFGAHGSGRGEFQSPTGVAVDHEGNILVSDWGNHRIQKFSAQGKVLNVIGTEGEGPVQFSFPTGIAVNASNGRIYVVDCGNSRIQILNSDFSYYGSFGRGESNKGQFSFPNPRHIACDSTGNVYVADLSIHHILVFSPEGEFLRMFGRCGEKEGQLNEPCGVAIDFMNRVYISECGNHRISVFTSEGKFVTSFGSNNEGLDLLDYPRGLAVDSSGVVYVCNVNKSLIQLF